VEEVRRLIFRGFQWEVSAGLTIVTNVAVAMGPSFFWPGGLLQ